MRKGNGWKRWQRRQKRPHRKGRNLHHLVPRSRNGRNHISNLLLIDIERHEHWHKMFGNMTIDEVLSLLTRMARMKSRHQEAA